ncbi:ABC transporter G family member 1 isoform X1 [Beta vulgaris subsp. vulgaris]|uniref:ABC transporter G family member 1 isoform X1 n=1 Tax=Beta vulgaris subsp. vulgaris TaxID=3555 RepID=UPI00203705E3|nr:ABC transporter G family member 1 isoform X1 [Beta vulgaris subsp. vulgaris]
MNQAYVAQDDTLMATLTVREAIHYSALLQLPASMLKSEKLATAEMAIQKMGLQDCSNNLIGGRTIRSISGGQKRRVSICMEILTRPQLLFLDEPTSGLDSAASYHVMRYIISLAKQEGITVIASLHQPSSEVFELFNKLCLLSYGKLVYFGSTPDAYTFFSVNAFPCPSMRNPSDHYLKIINNDFELGLEGKLSTENNINFLVQSYKSSEAHRQVQTRVSTICEHEGVKLEKGSQASFITQSLLLTKRSFVNMYRDPGYYRLRLAIYVVICMCLGILFHGLDDSYGSIQARISMLVYIGGFLTFMAIGGFPSFVEDMKIFERERFNGHYGVGVYVISNTLSSIPYLLLLSIVPGAITYYLSGLQKGFDHFICFVLLLFASMTMVESLMMIVASIVPDFLMGIITGSGIQGLMMLTSGYFRLPNDLPKLFWKYPMYYISFGTYVNQGFYKNEFEDLVFYDNDTHGAKHMISGEWILSNTLQVQDNSKWVDVAILLGMVVLYRLVFFGIIKVAEVRQKLSHTTKSA